MNPSWLWRPQFGIDDGDAEEVLPRFTCTTGVPTVSLGGV